MAKVGVAAINPITSLSTCASGLLLSGIDEFRNSYRDYMFRKVDGAIGNSAYGEQYYKAKAFVYELEKKACAAYEACQNLPQTLIKLALPKSAPDRILHGVDLIKNGKFKARGGILLGIAGVLFAGTGIGAAGVVAGLYTAGGGISQIAEGVQEVYYGIKGDTDTEVENVYSKYIYDDYYGCYDGSLEISASCGYSAFVEGLLGGAGLKNAGSGSESGSSSVNDIVDIMKSGNMTADGRNIITQLDENTKVIFRMDVGENAHSMEMYGYSNPVNHINIEIQVKASSGKYKPKWNFHMILDNLGEVSDSFATGIWTKK